MDRRVADAFAHERQERLGRDRGAGASRERISGPTPPGPWHPLHQVWNCRLPWLTSPSAAAPGELAASSRAAGGRAGGLGRRGDLLGALGCRRCDAQRLIDLILRCPAAGGSPSATVISATKSTKRRCTAIIPSRVPADVEPPLSVAVLPRRRLGSREVSKALAACQSWRAWAE